MTELTEVPGIGPTVAKQLSEAFVTTAELLAVQNVDDLQERTKIAEGTCNKIVRAARELLGMFEFKSAVDLEQEIDSKPRLKTGIEDFDEELHGGFETGSLIEFYGKAGGGKTQMCLHMAVRSLLPLEDGGLEGRVLWLDSERSMKPKILRANIKRWGLEPDDYLGNIRQVAPITTNHLMQLFERIPKICVEDDVKVVVVDSLTGFFRAEYVGLFNLGIRQQKINSLLNLMRRVATATDVIFFFTNHAISKPGIFAQPNAPVGGHVVAHASDYRFQAAPGKGNKRKMRLKDHAGLPDFEVNMSLGWGGFYSDERIRKKIEPDIIEYLENLGMSTDVPETEPVEEEEIEAEVPA